MRNINFTGQKMQFLRQMGGRLKRKGGLFYIHENYDFRKITHAYPNNKNEKHGNYQVLPMIGNID